MQRSTHCWLPSRTLNPHWTTAWSSTISTRRRSLLLRHGTRPTTLATSLAGSSRRIRHSLALGPELEHAAALQRLVGGELEAEPGARRRLGGPRPSFRTSSAKPPSRLVIAIRTSLGSACFSALRSASPSTETASGSSPSGTSASGSHQTRAGPPCTGARAGRARPAASSTRRRSGSARASGRARREAPPSAASISAAERSASSAESSPARAEHHRDAEEALHDALVDLARELDSLEQQGVALALGGRLAHGRRKRRGARRAPASSAARSASSSSSPPLRSAKITPNSARRRSPACTRSRPRSARRRSGLGHGPASSSATTTASRSSASRAIGVSSSAPYAWARISGLDPVAARRDDEAAGGVVEEEDGPLERGQLADRLADAVAETGSDSAAASPSSSSSRTTRSSASLRSGSASEAIPIPSPRRRERLRRRGLNPPIGGYRGGSIDRRPTLVDLDPGRRRERHRERQIGDRPGGAPPRRRARALPSRVVTKHP